MILLVEVIRQLLQKRLHPQKNHLIFYIFWILLIFGRLEWLHLEQRSLSLVLYVYYYVVSVVIHLKRVLLYRHRPIGHDVTDMNEKWCERVKMSRINECVNTWSDSFHLSLGKQRKYYRSLLFTIYIRFTFHTIYCVMRQAQYISLLLIFGGNRR